MLTMYSLLISLPHNAHYLNRYIKFIRLCHSDERSSFREKHHILPKSLFREYASFTQNPWNLARLTPRQHILAHRMLWKAYGDNQAKGYHILIHKHGQKLSSRHAARLREAYAHSLRGHQYNKGRKHTSEHIASRTRRGYHHSEETKHKIRDSHLKLSEMTSNRLLGNTYKLGKIESQETRERKRRCKVGNRWWHSVELHRESCSQECPPGFVPGRLPEAGNLRKLLPSS